jgi:anti-sigma B factor antagonist
MTDDASPERPAAASSVPGHGPHGWFEFLPAAGGEPVTVRAAGDIDLINVGHFQAALDQAVAISSTITADMTGVTYCDSAAVRVLFSAARRAQLTIRVALAGPITGTLLKVSGLDQVATVVTLD